jgi:hypothetical protein
MRGLVSFHGVDPSLVDEVVAPLLGGSKINPERFLEEAVRFRRNGWHASRFVAAMERLLVEAEAPEAPSGGRLLDRVRSGIERLRHEPDPRAVRLREAIDPDLHLEGRPFLILEGSAERVAAIVDEYLRAPDGDAAEALAREQVARLGAEVASALGPDPGAELEPEFNYGRDVLEQLRLLHELPRAARSGETWRRPDAPPRPARDALRDELAWRVASVHALARPFWIAYDVDGLETVCRAAGVASPDELVPAYRLVQPVLAEFEALSGALGTELAGRRSVGASVAPEDVGAVQSFLASHGARIIREAARHGEGPRCTTLLRKIRECLTWAEARGFGYLEASGIVPPYLDRGVLDRDDDRPRP